MSTYLLSHAVFERRHPDEAAYAVEIDRQRRANGLQPLREFPCPGSLEIVEDNGDHAIVVCSSGCGFSTTVRSPTRPMRDGHKERETTGSYGDSW